MQFDYTFNWDRSGAWHPATTRIDLEGASPDDHILEQIIQHKTFYEHDLLNHLARVGPIGGTYVDVGANIGNHSVFFGKFLAEIVVAIELNPLLIPVLRRNLETNGVARFVLVSRAIGEEAGFARIVLPPGAENNLGAGRLEVAEESTAPNAISGTVAITPLDQILDEVKPQLGGRQITLLKMDIEGLELSGLRGARHLLTEHKPQLVIELASPGPREEVMSYLAELGYKAVGQFCQTPTFHFVIPELHRPRGHSWTADASEQTQLSLLEHELNTCVPRDKLVILVDEERFRQSLSEHWLLLPFLEKDGQYWGPPADDEMAIREVERLRAAGACHIAFTSQTLWWLEHYGGFNRHLRSQFRCLVENERLVVFELRGNMQNRAS